MLIGDLGAAASLSTKTIRFYETSGLLPAPPRTPGGYRDYPAATVGRLAFIRQAQAAGLTLAEIGGILRIRDGGQAPCQHVTALIADHLAQVDQRIAELTRTRSALAELHGKAVVTEPADCAESQICSILAWAPGG
jgi:MerR family transcriptional regulator, copper efflux regulator